MIRKERPKPLKPVPVWKGPKPTLAMRQIPVYRVHCVDLQEYLLKVYRMELDIMAMLGLTHGMAPEYSVTGSRGDASNAQQQIDNVRRGYRCRNLHLILNVLCMDSFIPQGYYTIETTKRESAFDQYRKLVQNHEDPLHPECIQFKSKHRHDRIFQEHAVLMDEAVIKFNKDNES